MNAKLVIFALFALVLVVAESKRALKPCRSCTIKEGLLMCTLSCRQHANNNVDEKFTTSSDMLIHDPASCISCFQKATGESVCAQQCKNKKKPSRVYLSDGCRNCVADGTDKKFRCTGRRCRLPKKQQVASTGCKKALCTRSKQTNQFTCACNSTVSALADDSIDEYSTMSTCQHCYFTYVHGQRDITCVDEPCAADIADSIAEVADQSKTNGTETAVSIRYENCTTCWKENVNGNLIIRCEKDYNNKQCHIKNRSEAALSIVTPKNSATLHNLNSGCKKCTVALDSKAGVPSVKCVDCLQRRL